MGEAAFLREYHRLQQRIYDWFFARARYDGVIESPFQVLCRSCNSSKGAKLEVTHA